MIPTARNVVLLFSLSLVPACSEPKSFNPHPLDPLDSTEIAEAARLISADSRFRTGTLFPIIVLNEPPKAEVLNHKPGAPFRRDALAVLLERAHNKTIEAVVDLRAKKVTAWKEVPGVQPLVLVEEYETVPKIIKADARWQEAMRKRGITDFNRVQIDSWAAGHMVSKEHQATRLLRGITYLKDGSMNFYGRPIEGVIALVDVSARKVVDLIDTGNVPIAEMTVDFDEKSLAPLRNDLKPLLASQPQGPSFQVNGHEVRWQKWRFRFALHPREGLLLYNVGYEDQGQVRPILYRASLSEMVVPYGDSDVNWAWRNAFDAGEYGVGRLAAPLEKNRDGPSNAIYFDAHFSDDFGNPYIMKNVVGLYEEDGGILWKHFDIYSARNETRRGRRLVLFFVAAIGNYDYGLNWIFHQDGSLEVASDLTGIMLPKGVPKLQPGANGSGHHKASPFGHLVAQNVVAPHHQHFFNFRLDFDVDGPENTAFEMNTRALPAGRQNPFLNAMSMEDVPLKTEKEARRDMSLQEARKWLISNPSKTNELGGHPSYALLPAANTVPYVHPESGVRKRARFIDHHFWVTKHKPDEFYAAGDYPNQGKGGEGLIKWSGDDEPIENQDLVVWYTMGVTHIPRPEEWPIMPVHRIGFKLVPAGFFSRNPALDVPK